MGAGMQFASHQMPMMPGAKTKKEDKSKKDKPEEKPKKEGEKKAEATGSPAAAGAAAPRAPVKDAKLDWSKRKDAMIDTDDL
mmetsp:Transcript_78024/g.218885  ORF Transcript_78024/g.218885 Transcript_78024/m.218885 type:complete len:82 (+) Transcript_78024:2-247(+)